LRLKLEKRDLEKLEKRDLEKLEKRDLERTFSGHFLIFLYCMHVK
jgi:hypothetical protein